MLLAHTLRLRAVVLACAALLAAPSAVDAQRTVVPGAYVRILAPSVTDSLLTGTVIEIDSASLLLASASPARSLNVAVGNIERLEVRGPGAPRTLTGALIGTLAGAVAGYAVCHVASGSPHANCPTTVASYVGGTLGLVLGGIIGGHYRGPARWHPASAPRW